MSRWSFSALFVVTTLALGCAAPTEEVGTSGDAVTRSERQEGQALLEEAEELAAKHVTDDACDEGATTLAIIEKLHEAKRADGSKEFERTIGRSQKLRAAIGSTIDFAVLSGAIRVQESGNLSGLGFAATLADHIEVYGPARAGKGNVSKLAIDGQGRAIVSKLATAEDGSVSWTQAELAATIRELVGGTTITLETPEGQKVLRARHVPATNRGLGRFEIKGDEADTLLQFTSRPAECQDD